MIYLELAEGRIREFNLLKRYCNENNILNDIITKKDVERKRIVFESDFIADGTIPFIHAILNMFQKPIPVVDTYPPILRQFMLRDVRLTTLGNVSEGFYGFIKPAFTVKKFTGFIVKDPSNLRNIAHHSKHTEVYLSDPVEFVSEWRYYVINNIIRAKGHYDGDESIICDDSIVQKAVDAYVPYAHSAYCIDFGVLKDGRTALVEYNDSYSVGWYLDDDVDIYYELIFTRFRELMK